MKTINNRSIQNVLEKAHLQSLLNKVHELSHINQLLLNQLEPNVANHCRVANLKQDTLIIETDSSAWAMRIRYQAPQLIKQLRQSGLPQLNTIQCYIRPAEQTQQQPQREANKPSLENAQMLADTAKHIPNKALREALLKLSKQTS